MTKREFERLNEEHNRKGGKAPGEISMFTLRRVAPISGNFSNSLRCWLCLMEALTAGEPTSAVSSRCHRLTPSRLSSYLRYLSQLVWGFWRWLPSV